MSFVAKINYSFPGERGFGFIRPEEKLMPSFLLDVQVLGHDVDGEPFFQALL